MKRRSVCMRFLLLLLSLALCMAVLAACGGESEKKPSGYPGNTAVTDPALKEFEALDFKDEEIIISLSRYTWTEIPLESHQFVEGPDRVGWTAF